MSVLGIPDEIAKAVVFLASDDSILIGREMKLSQVQGLRQDAAIYAKWTADT